jgi:hypothetical protein
VSTKSFKPQSVLYAQELRTIRLSINLDLVMMANRLGLDYHTYRSYEYAHRTVPARVMVAARALPATERAAMAQIKQEIEESIARLYPHGIPSIPVDIS